MDTKINYTLVGFILIVLTGVMIAMLLWWTKGLNREVYTTYMVYMDQDVSGLSSQAPVKYNGVPVGYVGKMELDTADPQFVILYLQVKANVPVTTSTVATLQTQGITGITYISLSTKTPDAPALTALPDQKYPVIPEQPSILNQLTQSAQQVFDQQNIDNLKQILANLSTVSKTLADNSNTINSILANSAETFKNTAQASKDLPVMITQVRQSMQQFNAFTTNANQMLMPTLEFMNRLNQITDNLVYVSNELKQNPSILIRGTSTNNLGPGE